MKSLHIIPTKKPMKSVYIDLTTGASIILKKMIFGGANLIFRQTGSQMKRMKKRSRLNLLFFDQPKLRTKRAAPSSR